MDHGLTSRIGLVQEPMAAASSSRQRQVIDHVWSDFKRCCDTLRIVKKQNERRDAMDQMQKFLSDESRRFLVHKWCSWGYLWSSWLVFLKEEFGSILFARMETKPKRRTLPKIEFYQSFGSQFRASLFQAGSSPSSNSSMPSTSSSGLSSSNSLSSCSSATATTSTASAIAAASNTAAAPKLHLDFNGRQSLLQTVEFAIQILTKIGDFADANANSRAHHSAKIRISSSLSCDQAYLNMLEREAWNQLDIIVQFRVYCAVLPRQQLQEILELALVSLSNGANGSSTDGVAGGRGTHDRNSRSSDQVLLLQAQVVHSILKNAPFDLHGWLPKLVDFFVQWMETLERAPKAAYVANKLLETFLDLIKTYYTSIGPLVMQNGLEVLHFVQRSWYDTLVRLKHQPAEFIVLFLQAFESNERCLLNQEPFDNATLLKEMRLCAKLLLNPKEMLKFWQQARSNISVSSANSNSNCTMLQLDHQICTYFICAAEVLYHHDVCHAKTNMEKEQQDAETKAQKVDSPPSKRARQNPPNTGAEISLWTRLLDNIVDKERSTENAVTSATSGGVKATAASPHGRFGGSLGRNGAPWLLVLLALLVRRGDFIMSKHADDMLGVARQMINNLTVSDSIGDLQFLSLYVLIQITCLQPRNSSRDWVVIWRDLWDVLLRVDAPYAKQTEDAFVAESCGNLVVVLLHCCVYLELIPKDLLQEQQSKLWSLLSVYSSPKSTSLSGTNWSNAPVALLTLISHKVEFLAFDDVPKLPAAATNDKDNFVVDVLFDWWRSQLPKKEPGCVSGQAASQWSMDYGKAFLWLLEQDPSRVVHCFDTTKPELLCLLSRNVANPGCQEHVTVVQQSLHGFGVDFVHYEFGIARFQETYWQYLVPQVVKGSVNRSEFSTDLTARFLGEPSASDFPRRVRHNNSLRQFIMCSSSRSTDLAMHHHLESIIHRLSTVMASIEMGTPQFFSTMSGLLDVCLVLGCIYGVVHRTHRDLKLTQLISTCFDALSSCFSSQVLVMSLHHQVACQQLLELCQKIFLFLALLQGIPPNDLFEYLNLTSAIESPADLKIPLEFRQSLRNLVASIEAFLKEVATDDGSIVSSRDPASLGSIQTSHSSAFTWSTESHGSSQGRNEFPSSQSSTASSFGMSTQRSATQRSRPSDILDNNETPLETRSSAMELTQKALYLWLIRLLLLLKKETGFALVREVVTELDFNADFMLAVAGLITNVSRSHDSLDNYLRFVKYAVEEQAAATVTGTTGGRSQAIAKLDVTCPMHTIFAAQVIDCLANCCELYELQRGQVQEPVPEELQVFARQQVNAWIQPSSLPEEDAALNLDQFRVGRILQLRLLGVLFRINAEQFDEFVDVCMKYLRDADLSVRLLAASSVETLFYMYPEGTEAVFQDIVHCLKGLWHPTAGSTNSAALDMNSLFDDAAQVQLSMEYCVGLLTTLYHCATSPSAQVLPQVLALMVQLCRPSRNIVPCHLVNQWSCAVAKCHGYASSPDLYDKHFAFIWRHHMGIYDVHALLVDQDGAESLLKPLSSSGVETLFVDFPINLWESRSADSTRVFLRHLDHLFVVGALYDVICNATPRSSFSFVVQLKQLLIDTRNSDRLYSQVLHMELLCTIHAMDVLLELRACQSNNTQFSVIKAKLAHVVSHVLADPSCASTGMFLDQMVDKLFGFWIEDVIGSATRDPSENAFDCSTALSLAEDKSLPREMPNERQRKVNWIDLILTLFMWNCHWACDKVALDTGITMFCQLLQTKRFQEQVANQVALCRVAFHFAFQLVWLVGESLKQQPSMRVRLTCLLTQALRAITHTVVLSEAEDPFGKNLSLVVQQIAGLFRAEQQESRVDKSVGETRSQQRTMRKAKWFSEEARANLEWIILSIHQDLAHGLGKYVPQIRPFGTGIAPSLDKLHAQVAPTWLKTNETCEPHEIARELEGFVQTEYRVWVQQAAHRHTEEIACTKTREQECDSSLLLQLSRVKQQITRAQKCLASGDNSEDHCALRKALCQVVHWLLTMSLQPWDDCMTPGTVIPSMQERLMIADCLGEIGAMDADEFDLNPADNLEHLNRLSRHLLSRSALSSMKPGFYHEMIEQLLHLLVSLLYSLGEQVRTISTAQVHSQLMRTIIQVLKNLMQDQQVLEAVVNTKNSDLKQFLESFIHAATVGVYTNQTLDRHFCGDVDDAEVCQHENEFLSLWRVEVVAQKTFSQWIRQVCGFLAMHGGHPVLQACVPVIQRLDQIAILLFPFVLQHLFYGDDGTNPALDVLAQDTHAGITAFLQQNAASIEQRTAPTSLGFPSEILQLLVHTISFLRETEKLAFVESNGRNKIKIRGCNHRFQDQQGSKCLAYGRIFEDSLLSIASIAVRCQMPFSAMQYAELFFEKQYGSVSFASAKSIATSEAEHEFGGESRQIIHSSFLVETTLSQQRHCKTPREHKDGFDSVYSLQQQQNALAFSILIKAYRLIDSVDGIYGINDGCTLESQLLKYNHEGNFMKSLPIYDVLLQGEQQPKKPFLEGMLYSLRRTGLEYSLQQYLSTIVASNDPSLQDSTAWLEAQYEKAWRNMQWDAAISKHAQTSFGSGPLVLGNGISKQELYKKISAAETPFGHHEMLFKMLRALFHEDFDQVVRLARISKLQVLNTYQLGLRGLENARESYQMLGQLQHISQIEQFAERVFTWKETARAQQASVQHASQSSFIGSSAACSTTSPPPAPSIDRFFSHWNQRHSQLNNDFDLLEESLTLQAVLAMTMKQLNVKSVDQAGVLRSIHLQMACTARKAQRFAISYRALSKLDQLAMSSGEHEHNESMPIQEQVAFQMEKAKLLWAQQEVTSCLLVAKELEKRFAGWLKQNSPTRGLRVNGNGIGGDEEGGGGASLLGFEQYAHLRLMHVRILTTIGNWLAQLGCENSQSVTENYLQKAADNVGRINNTFHLSASQLANSSKAHLALANYLAELFHQVHTRVHSSEWLAGKKCIEARQSELEECLSMNKDIQSDNRAHIHALNKEVQYDFEERAKVEASVDQFLVGALQSFTTALSWSSKAELATIFRVISLWFGNLKKSCVHAAMQQLVQQVASFKFVPLSYQIISRIGEDNVVNNPISASEFSQTDEQESEQAQVAFQKVLRELVLKLCIQHPHHALVQLIALKNSADVEGKGALAFRMNAGDAKAQIAQEFLTELRRTSTSLCGLLDNMDTLCHAYTQLAMFDTQEFHGQPGGANKKIPFAKLRHQTNSLDHHLPGGSNSSRLIMPLDQCLRRRTTTTTTKREELPAVLTCTIAPRADMDYSDVVRVHSFDPSFAITDSGIHRPKIVFCIGSDGTRFKQLVKGKDDTRQDLVIEQVFETVNVFLREDSATSKRKLRLQTYKVVPLSPLSGVLEWKQRTIPWGSYLVSKPSSKKLGAHERYHPHEWKQMKCRAVLKNATPSNKLQAFQEIERHFTPVFHHFFLEQFPDPSDWFAKRNAYVQSVAVTSMIGYLLGIGDRHAQNILIHQDTAELVHIDFGVVFDQGMALFTPETVPFRLTRDMVDGMGVSGCEGVFTRCCEVVLRLMRKHHGSLLTILEVFVHDPLYRWTLSPLKALRIQEGLQQQQQQRSRGRGGARALVQQQQQQQDDLEDLTRTNRHDAATRALIRAKQKLQGYEDPNGSALSVEGQVQQLIRAAQDPHNLCVLFPGWSPWL